MTRPSRQLCEIGSWRIATELLRRHPSRLSLMETHPGGGQYDCLELYTTDQPGLARAVVTFNRVGSVFVRPDGDLDRETSWPDFWIQLAAAEDPKHVLDRLCALAGLPPVSPVPVSSPEVLTYRLISAFLTHTAFGRFRWEGRNGMLDSSSGSGPRRTWFHPFDDPAAAVQEGQPHQDFWFLVRGEDDPQLCLSRHGAVWDRHGRRFDLPTLYTEHGRIYPTMVAIAGRLLR